MIHVHDFNTPEERDAWLDRAYPTRLPLDSPGTFEIPRGYLHVFLNTVTVSEEDDDDK